MAESVRIQTEANGAAPILVPLPFSGFGREYVDLAVYGGRVLESLTAVNTGQQALLIQAASKRVCFEYVFEQDSADPPQWIWGPPDSRYARASPALSALVAELAPPRLDERSRIDRLAQHTVEVFEYGHGDGRFTDGHSAVPALGCGVTRGSCVDIHTYFMTALLAAGIPAAYVAGIFLKRGEAMTNDMHCWVTVAERDCVSQWDLSHALQTGNDPSPGLSDIAGQRVALSTGRGLRFEANGHTTEVCHFGQPVAWDTGEELAMSATIAVGGQGPSLNVAASYSPEGAPHWPPSR